MKGGVFNDELRCFLGVGWRGVGCNVCTVVMSSGIERFLVNGVVLEGATVA